MIAAIILYACKQETAQLEQLYAVMVNAEQHALNLHATIIIFAKPEKDVNVQTVMVSRMDVLQILFAVSEQIPANLVLAEQVLILEQKHANQTAELESEFFLPCNGKNSAIQQILHLINRVTA